MKAVYSGLRDCLCYISAVSWNLNPSWHVRPSLLLAGSMYTVKTTPPCQLWDTRAAQYTFGNICPSPSICTGPFTSNNNPPTPSFLFFHMTLFSFLFPSATALNSVLLLAANLHPKCATLIRNTVLGNANSQSESPVMMQESRRRRGSSKSTEMASDDQMFLSKTTPILTPN